jgi:hypothetical protein
MAPWVAVQREGGRTEGSRLPGRSGLDAPRVTALTGLCSPVAGVRQFIRLSRCDPEDDSSARCVPDDYGLGPKAAKRVLKRLTLAAALPAPLCGRSRRLGTHPDAVPSRKAIPSSTPRFWAVSSQRSRTPRRARQRKTCAAFHQGSSSAEIARHLATFWRRRRIASAVRRRSEGGTFAGDGRLHPRAPAPPTARPSARSCPNPPATQAEVVPSIGRSQARDVSGYIYACQRLADTSSWPSV